MKHHFFAALAALALFVTFSSAASSDPAAATIRGERDRVLLANVGSYVLGVDGRALRPSPPMYETPIELAAGPHSLLIGFNASKYATLPVRLDAKPGAAYVIRFEQTGQTRDETVSTVWIEDEHSREIAMPKRQIWPAPEAASYAPPAAGAPSATIRGATADNAPGVKTYLGAVDGVFTSIAEADRTKPVTIAAGPHALLASYASDILVAEFPVLIDVKPGNSYVIGFSQKDRLVSTMAPPHIYMWVDNETTHEHVVPSTEVPPRRLKYNLELKPALGHKS